jgi:4-oxalocrotonate tautomerase
MTMYCQAKKREDNMPVIRIDMLEGRTQEQKRRIVKEITETMTRIAGTKREDVRIIIVDHPMENLAAAGQLLIDDPTRKQP